MLHYVFEWVFFTICGWVGHVVVRFLTLGRVKLDWGTESESNVAEAIGAIILVVVAILIITFLL